MVTFARLIVGALATTLVATVACSSSSSGGSGNESTDGTGSSSSSAAPGGGACYTIVGTGASEACQYDSSTSPGFTCASAGSKSGSCPSSGLEGCCVMKTTIGGYSSVVAQCYYNATTAAAVEPTCTGSSGSWSTTAP